MDLEDEKAGEGDDVGATGVERSKRRGGGPATPKSAAAAAADTLMPITGQTIVPRSPADQSRQGPATAKGPTAGDDTLTPITGRTILPRSPGDQAGRQTVSPASKPGV